MNLIKTISNRVGLLEANPFKIQKQLFELFAQASLKKSDATDAGKTDIENKAVSQNDVQFNLMRNIINTNGNVSGSDITNYIERAEELNDEVDTIPFGLETDDGQIVKVYVNVTQADKFEAAMKNMLGIEDDIEEAINRLTTEFDIVDVVWPITPEDDEDLDIDDSSNFDNEDDDYDDYDVIADISKDKNEESDDEDDEDEDDEEEPLSKSKKKRIDVQKIKNT